MLHSYTWAKENTKDVGEIYKTGNSYILVDGIKDAVMGEVVSFESGSHGVVTKLDSKIQVMSFSQKPLLVGEKVARTGYPLRVSVGDGLWGNTVNCLGYMAEGEDKEPSSETDNCLVDVTAGDISTRKDINKFMETGVAVVDLMVPLAKGQRELVIGDQKTGKSEFALQSVITQAKNGTKCIIALIGKQKTEIISIEKNLSKAGVRDKTIIVAESASEIASRIYLTPYTAMAMAEYFKNKGEDVLLVLDDLSYHALRYREMALLGDVFAGRDSYPGDIFFAHSKLLERAGCFEVNGKPVSITCLALAETVEGDLTGYIQTNLMSMTDGHILFDKSLFYEGLRPAVNVFLSVTRVGKQTQPKILKSIHEKMLDILSTYSDLKRFLRFGPELTEENKEIIRLAEGIHNFFTQRSNVYFDTYQITALSSLLWSGLWNGELLKPDKYATLGALMKELFNKNDIFSITFEDAIRIVDKNKNKFLEILNK